MWKLMCWRHLATKPKCTVWHDGETCLCINKSQTCWIILAYIFMYASILYHCTCRTFLPFGKLRTSLTCSRKCNKVKVIQLRWNIILATLENFECWNLRLLIMKCTHVKQSWPTLVQSTLAKNELINFF